MEDLIRRHDTIDAMEGVDWYHIDKDGQLVHGANSKEDEPLYKASDVYAVLNKMPSAQPETHEERTETHACDLIDRQAAIDTLDKHLRTTDVPVSYPGIISALTEWLNELPSAQPDSKELSFTQKKLDTISRQAAIDTLFELYEYQRDIDPTEAADLVRQGIYLAEKKIEQLPSAQPEVLACGEGELIAQPEIVRCKDCKHWKDSDGVYRRGIGAESKCPVNIRAVYEGNFYCADAERRTDESD